MKKIITILSLSLAAIFVLLSDGGCQKHNINGDLDGMWQVMEVEELGPEGEVQNTFAPVQHYICFQLHICQLRIATGAIGSPGTGNLTYQGNTISLSFPYATTEDEIRRLAQWGIFTTAPVFTVETLNGSTLVMHSEHSRLHCRKF